MPAPPCQDRRRRRAEGIRLWGFLRSGAGAGTGAQDAQLSPHGRRSRRRRIPQGADRAADRADRRPRRREALSRLPDRPGARRPARSRARLRAARIAPEHKAAKSDSLFLLYSNTKVVTATALWVLAERGAFAFTDRVADHLPDFARHGKGEITVLQLITHQGGFPNALVPEEVWNDHARLRRTVCDFTLEWTPGSRIVYHPSAAHWTAAMLIEALTGVDFRDFIRDEVIAPLGLGNDIFVGLPDRELGRVADMHEPIPSGSGPAGSVQPLPANNSPSWR